jgi:8-oxo-dGTP diphosphatase
VGAKAPETANSEGLGESRPPRGRPPGRPPLMRPLVAVDAVALTVDGETLKVGLVRRDEEPYDGWWVLPGGFVGEDETLGAAVERVLRDKAGLEADYIEQLYTFGDPGRDPRDRVISVAHLCVCRPERFARAAESMIIAEVVVPWEGETGGPALVQKGGQPEPMGFDHEAILGLAILRIRGKLPYSRLGFSFLADSFTLAQARTVYEVLLGRRLNKDSFRRTLLQRHDLVPTGERQGDVGHRPAELYRLGRRHVDPLNS